VALGYTMVYGIIELINFAHGDIFALGAFVSLTVMEHLDPVMVNNGNFLPQPHTVNLLGLHLQVPALLLVVWTLFISMVIAALVCGTVGVLIERIAYRPLRNAPKLAPLITAIGMSFIIENLLSQWREESRSRILAFSRASTSPVSDRSTWAQPSATLILRLLSRP
jgi:branched-chain amino acid transport system permease protein